MDDSEGRRFSIALMTRDHQKQNKGRETERKKWRKIKQISIQARQNEDRDRQNENANI